MQPNEIIVGKRYINKKHPGIVWLGCGDREGMFTTTYYRDKRLVIVECTEADMREHWLGCFAKQPDEGIDSTYWGAFELEENQNEQ